MEISNQLSYLLSETGHKLDLNLVIMVRSSLCLKSASVHGELTGQSGNSGKAVHMEISCQLLYTHTQKWQDSSVFRFFGVKENTLCLLLSKDPSEERGVKVEHSGTARSKRLQ